MASISPFGGLGIALDSIERRKYEEQQIGLIQSEIAGASARERTQEHDRQLREQGIAALAQKVQENPDLQNQIQSQVNAIPQGGPPVAAPPGQASAPMMSTFGPGGAPGGAPHPPQPPGLSWRPGATAPPQLGGQPPGSPGAPVPPQVAPRPPPPSPPPQAYQEPMAVFQWALKQGKSPEVAYAAMEAAVPIADDYNKRMLAQAKEEVDIQRALTAYEKSLRGPEVKPPTQDADITSSIAAWGGDTSKRLEQQTPDVRQKVERDLQAQRRRKDAPTTTMINLAGGGEDKPEKLTEGGKKVAAELVRTGRPLPGGWSTKGMGRGNAILNQMALEEEGGAGSGAVAGSLADYRANSAALTQNTKDLAMIEPFKNMVHQNGDIAKNLATKVIKTDSRLANKTINELQQISGDYPDLSEYLAQMHIFEVEASRLVTQPRIVGQLTVEAQRELKEILSGDMPLKSTVRVINRLQNDSDRRTTEMQKTHDELEKAVRGQKKEAAKPSATSSSVMKFDSKGNLIQ